MTGKREAGSGKRDSVDDVLLNPSIARLATSLKASPGKTAPTDATVRQAAIALILRMGALKEPELLMIKRAEAAQDPWSGHVACPGGRMELDDRDLTATAFRETLEETGIDLARVGRVLGTLDDLSPRTPVLPPIVIRPFVVAVPATVEIVQSREVAAAFWVPLSAIKESRAWKIGTVHVRGVAREEPTFTHGEYLVWGLTERVLKQLLVRMS